MDAFLVPLLGPILVVLLAAVLGLLQAVARLRQRVRDIEARLAALQAPPAVAAPSLAGNEPAMEDLVAPVVSAGVAAGAPAMQPPVPRPESGTGPLSPPIEPPAPAVPSVGEPSPAAPDTRAAGWGELEGRVGGRWLNRIGALILVVGIGFFLKYAFDADWISPAGRVGIGLLAGIALLSAGVRLRAAYRNPAQGLVAAGLGALYITGYAAHAFYDLITQPLAFAFFALVTAIGIALAVGHDARAVALIASLAGLLTPVVVGPEHDAAGPLFTYLAVLDAGILASAYWRRWTELPVVSFLGTQALYAAWFDTWYAPEKLAVALGAATAFFALFALVAPLDATARPRAATGRDRIVSAAFVLAVPTAYLLAARAILYAEQRSRLALLCLGLCLTYALLGRWTLSRAPAARALGLLHLAVAVGCLTVAVAVGFGPHLTTIAWSAEAVVVLWGGLVLGSGRLRVAGLAILALAGARWLTLVTDQPGSSGPFLVGSPLFLPTLAFAAACVAAAVADARGRPAGERESVVWPLLVLTAVGSVALFVSTEVAEFSPLRFVRGYAAVLRTLVWTAAAVPVLALVRADRTRLLLVAATGLLLVLGAGAATVDVDAWRRLGVELRTPLLNLRFFSGLALVALYAWYAWVVPLWPVRSQENARRLRRLAVAAAALFLLWHASAEVSLLPLPGLSLAEATKLRQMGLSILWALYAFAAMAIGMRRDVAVVRIGAIALFGLTVGKVLLVDLRELDAVYRILSFVVLGAVLLAASFLYARSRSGARVT